MNFYTGAHKRLKVVQAKMTIAAEEYAEQLEACEESLAWLKELSKEWTLLERRTAEMKCGMPKLKSEDDRQAEINNCLCVAESGEFFLAFELLAGILDRGPAGISQSKKYVRPKVSSFEDVKQREDARFKTPANRIIIM
ncbi:MAG: hypothetical protein EOP06_02380 [Proteobacteria bacterium]|nr:MAG: hypothetical protein EOP06_02380 [Pseudomonadota bacterium]